MPHKHAQPMFGTHRGRTVRRWLVGLFVASLGVSRVVGLVSGGDVPTAAPTTSGVYQAEPVEVLDGADRRVAAAVANPFFPYAGANIAAGDAPTAAASDPAQQAAVTAATQTAIAYATYGYGQTPQQYAAAVPNLSKKAKVAVAKAAVAGWPGVDAAKVTAVARQSGIVPTVENYQEGVSASVAVTVAQDVVMAGSAAQVRARTLLVQLRAITGATMTTWEVADITTLA